MPKSTGGEWFGAPAAARYLLINAGEIPAYKIGRVIRLRRVEVDDFIERSRVGPGELDHLLYGPDPAEPDRKD